MFRKTLHFAKRFYRRMLRLHQAMMWNGFGRKRDREISNLLSSVPVLAAELATLRQRLDEIGSCSALNPSPRESEREEIGRPANPPSSSF